MQRSDVVILATGSGYGSKPRPALLIQSDLLVAKPTVILLGFTSAIREDLRWRPIFDATPDNGLQTRSALMADSPFIAPRERVGRIVGRFSVSEMSRAESALAIVLGLG